MSDSKPRRNGLVLMTEKYSRKPPTQKAKKEIEKAKKARAAAPKMDLDEIKNLEEPIYQPLDHKPKGRPKNENYLSYAEAREFIRGELIPSRNKYLEWWERNKPKSIPRFPYRVYKEWTSWNDFLGNDNEFGLKVAKTWRSLEDAVQWVHKQKIESYTKWMEFCKEHREILPDDIPCRPDLVYPGWKTWNHWLGNRPVEMLEVAREAAKTQIYYIIHDTSVPENVFTFGVEPGGSLAFKERWEREKFDIIRIFWHEPAQADQVKKIIEALSSPYLGNDKQRICPNFWELNYYLEITLQRILKF